MALDKVWVRTLSDGLVRADQIVGLSNYQTPDLPGKVSHWLLDATLAIPAGSGLGDGGWDINALHRTLLQSSVEQVDAPDDLARLLAGLDTADTTGIVAPHVTRHSGEASHGSVRFVFTPFADVDITAR